MLNSKLCRVQRIKDGWSQNTGADEQLTGLHSFSGSQARNGRRQEEQNLPIKRSSFKLSSVFILLYLPSFSLLNWPGRRNHKIGTCFKIQISDFPKILNFVYKTLGRHTRKIYSYKVPQITLTHNSTIWIYLDLAWWLSVLTSYWIPQGTFRETSFRKKPLPVPGRTQPGSENFRWQSGSLTKSDSGGSCENPLLSVITL